MRKINQTILSFSFLFIFPFTLFAQQSPGVANFPAADPPAIPSDLKVTCLTDPNSLQSATTCPVIVWNEYVYWVYSFVDNRVGMSVVAYTEDGALVKRWDLSGARYITNIAIDEKAQTITLIGQAKQAIVVNWKDLYLPIPPEAGTVPSNIHPIIPTGSKMTCMQSADVLGKMDTCYVLEWGNVTYWAYSYIDNRVSFNIVAYDERGNIMKQWEAPGARYLYKITVEPAAQTVTFWGQANQKVVLPWNQLLVQKSQ